MELVSLFYLVDEFCKESEPQWRAHLLASGAQRLKPCSLSLSEILTILVHFHQSNHKTFKGYYVDYVSTYLRSDFPGLVSYGRFVELVSKVSLPLHALLTSLQAGPTRANFMDSTTLAAATTTGYTGTRLSGGVAARGKSSTGWFYGFKLHLVVNERGELTSFMLTPGNVADNNAELGVRLCARPHGKLYADRGYISEDLMNSLQNSRPSQTD